MLKRGLELLTMLKEDLALIGAEDIHQLQRHGNSTAGCGPPRPCSGTPCTARKRGGQASYYYRGDFPKLDDAEWHAFTASQYDAKTDEWQMSRLLVHRVIV